MMHLKALPPLSYKSMNTGQIFYKRFCPNPTGFISFRSLSLQEDVPLLHGWINQPYAKRFWQSAKPMDELQEMYNSLLSNPHRHALTGLFDGKPVCHIEVYQVLSDEIASFIPGATSNDTGIHFLMAPPRNTFKGLSRVMLYSFLEAHFNFPFNTLNSDLYAEPDELNTYANRLAVDVGFKFLKKINFPHKMANLYRMTRQDFLSHLPLINVVP